MAISSHYSNYLFRANDEILINYMDPNNFEYAKNYSADVKWCVFFFFPLTFKNWLFECGIESWFTCTNFLCYSHMEYIKKRRQCSSKFLDVQKNIKSPHCSNYATTQNTKRSETSGNFWILSSGKTGELWTWIGQLKKSGCLAAGCYLYSHFHGNCCCTDWKWDKVL